MDSRTVQPAATRTAKTLYQFEVPFVIDDSETRTTFGIAPTPWPDVLDATIAAYRGANISSRSG